MQFIPNEESKLDLEEYTAKDGIDIYIDGARHLSDNATVTKVICYILDKDLNQVISPEEVFSQVSTSTLRNQNFGHKIEVRPKNKLKPSCLLILRLITVDMSTLKPCNIGAVCFPLFMDMDREEPPTDNSPKRIQLMEGNWQLPIYHGVYKESKAFTYMNLVYKERVPTASALVRVFKAPKDAQGNPLSKTSNDPRANLVAPNYSEGVYNNQYIILAKEEVYIMKLRRLRPNPPLRDVLDDVLTLSKENPSSMTPDAKLSHIRRVLTEPKSKF